MRIPGTRRGDGPRTRAPGRLSRESRLRPRTLTRTAPISQIVGLGSCASRLRNRLGRQYFLDSFLNGQRPALEPCRGRVVLARDSRAGSRNISSLACSAGVSGAPRFCRSAAAAPAKRRERCDCDCAAAAEQAKHSSTRATPRLWPSAWNMVRLSLYRGSAAS